MEKKESKIPENTREVIKIPEGYYAELSKKDYQLKAIEFWKEFFIKKIIKNGHDISEIDEKFSDTENGLTIDNDTARFGRYSGIEFDVIRFDLWYL